MTRTQQLALLSAMNASDPGRSYRVRQRGGYVSALVGWLIIFGVIFAAWVAMP